MWGVLEIKEETMSKNKSIQKLTLTALLTALVIVLQLLGSFIRLGMFSVSLVLVPIVIGAATCGILSGAFLGFVFGMVVLISGDAAGFMTINAFGTIVTVLLKGTLCGLLSGLTYKLLEKKNRVLAVFAAAIVCPIVNTGVFLLGCFAFFFETIKTWAGDENLVKYFIFGLGLLNFPIELLFNMVLSPVIVRLIDIKNK